MSHTIQPTSRTGAPSKPRFPFSISQILTAFLAVTSLCLASGCASFNTVAKNAPDPSLCGPFPENYIDLLRAWVRQIRPEPVKDLVVSPGKTVREFEVTFVGKPVPARDASGTCLWVVPVVIEKRAIEDPPPGDKKTAGHAIGIATQFEVFIRDGQIKNPAEAGSGVRETMKFLSKYGYAYVVGYSAKPVEPAYGEGMARGAKVDR